MIPEIENVKGFQDFLPPESLKRDAVRKIVEKHFRLHGFLPIETPLIEFDELMRPDTISGTEDEAVSDRFRLKDRGGRNLGLRYEFTFQLKRLLKQHPNIKLPFRRYQIGENFRDEPIGPGRFRQFTQCDVDIVGDETIDSDVECLSLAASIFKELKIPFEINVNNRKLLSAIIDSVEMREKKSVMRELDKLDKIGEDLVKSNLLKYGDGNQIVTLFKLLEKDIEFFKKNAFEGANEITELSEKCAQQGIKIKFNPIMIRGLGYYTGNIFEIKIEGEKNTISAGGRYDDLVGKYVGRKIPAVGISFGLERLCQFAKVKVEGTKVILISLQQDKAMQKIAKTLRTNEISCLTNSGKVGKALEYANSYSIPFAIFIGETEVEKGKFKLKNMKSGEEKYLTEKQLISTLSKAD